MSSRQEEKERRRQQRLELERQEAAAAARKRRLGIVAATVLGVAALVAVGIAVTAGGGSKAKGTGTPTSTPSIPAVAIPARKISNLAQAAKAAGCTLRNYPNFGRNHTTNPVTYKTNPPTSGDHNPVPASDGNYVGVQTPAKEHLVHSLEHGRIEVQYGPGVTPHQIGQLESLFNERQQYMLLFKNNTNMPYPVAVTAWQHMLACPQFNSKIFDAIRAFRDAYTLKAPEFITQAE
jgi:Protein of unknown function (DUF3105)